MSKTDMKLAGRGDDFHLAVLNEGTLRVVLCSGGEAHELAAMSVGDGRDLEEIVSVAGALVEMSRSLTGSGGSVAVVGKGLEDAPTRAKPKSKYTKRRPKLDPENRRRGRKRHPSHKYTDDDIIRITRHLTEKHGAAQPAKIALAVCLEHGIPYRHEEPLAKSVTNRARRLLQSGVLRRGMNGWYMVAIDDLQDDHEELETAIAAEEAAELAEAVQAGEISPSTNGHRGLDHLRQLMADKDV